MEVLMQEVASQRKMGDGVDTGGSTDPSHGAVTFDELRIPRRAIALMAHHYLDRPDTIMFMISMVMARVFMAWITRFSFITVLVLCVIASAALLVGMVGLFAKAMLTALEAKARTKPPAVRWERASMEGAANRWRIIDDVMRTVLNILFWLIMEMCGSFMDGMVTEGAHTLMFITPLTILFAFRGFMLVLHPQRLPFPSKRA